ncbi:hypothetical protein Acsp03_58320 [Actinomadura sp. NBRC 104412]|uniref:hypothetical protein n=1 Tax=Actinomadura sp. NBRC 104412 TaxID=3032203 RepID=UPI0024A3C13F|nr:hypothetical protein [Actinomadura sp. NBRC 104412]GLZ08366.1 hypothetical protein Acsp03_58320 [Actinomadura sp. NBRC 104412]
MASDQDFDQGMDFWAFIGVTEADGDGAAPQPGQAPQGERAAGKGRAPRAKAPRPPKAPREADEVREARKAGKTKGSTEVGAAVPVAKGAPVAKGVPAANGASSEPASVRPAQWPAPPTAASAPSAPSSPSWEAAERLYHSLRGHFTARPADVVDGPRRAAGLKALIGPAQGDSGLAAKVHDLLNGWHLLGELWRDPDVEEIHIRGTEVIVCGSSGVREIPGFGAIDAARRAVEAVIVSSDDAGAVLTESGGSIIVSRRNVGPTDTAALVDAGVVTRQQISEVERTLRDLSAVTLTGPAAWVVLRAFASLIPPGSRIFLGPFGVLPRGCVAAVSPLCADYVVGVRLGGEAEEMAAAGQIGALIANPRTPFTTGVRYTVSGRFAAPGKVTAH